MSLRSTVKRRGVVPRGALRALTFGCDAETGAAAAVDEVTAEARGEAVSPPLPLLLSVAEPGTIIIASLALRDMVCLFLQQRNWRERSIECNSCGEATFEN